MAQKALISRDSETVRARAKTDEIFGLPTEKDVFDGNFILGYVTLKNCVLEQKGLISETVRVRAKRTKFWVHPRKKTYLTENFNFW